MKFLSFLNIQTTPLSDRLVELFLNWSRENNMICNLSKSKELVVRKKKGVKYAYYTTNAKIFPLRLSETTRNIIARLEF